MDIPEGRLDGRVVVVTGAGRGIGREHALLCAAEGALVVVNDLGGAPDGSGASGGPAAEVVSEIRAAGGTAVASTDDVTTGAGADALVALAVETYGRLDALVNNAGVLRDRMLVNMSEDEWDDVVRVHLRGHFLPTRAAAAHWRSIARTGEPVAAAVVNTTSTSGLFGLVGQSNYGAAKMGIAALTLIANEELARYGVRVNAIAPAARTRLTADIPGSAEREAAAQRSVVESGWDPRSPANISPFVAYLVTRACPIAGRIFFVRGGQVSLVQPFTAVADLRKDGRWTVFELEKEAEFLADHPLEIVNPARA